MVNKKCNRCANEKLLSEFSKNPKSIDGYNTLCKECVKKTRRVYQEKNRVIINEKQRLWNLANPDKVKSTMKAFRVKHKEKISNEQKAYREANREKIKKIKKDYCDNNKDKIDSYRKKYYAKKKADILKKNRDWNKKNAHIVGWRSVLKSQLRRFGKKKEGKTIDILGYSAEELKNHIQSLFTEGMSWGNHGEWEIDHIKPVTSFDKETPPSVVNALSNLQPLWRSENREKYTKH